MDLDVTVRAVRILRVQVMLRTGRLFRADTMSRAVTSQTKLCYPARDQQTRIRRPVRCMTRNAAVRLNRSMLVNKWSLLIRVTLDAGSVSAGRQSRLLELETAVRIVAIAALHRAFEDLVMKRFVEVGLNFVVTAYAELRLADFQEIACGKVGFFRVGGADEGDRLGDVSISYE